MTGEIAPGVVQKENMQKGKRQANYTFLSTYLVDFVDIERNVGFDVLERFNNPAHSEQIVGDGQSRTISSTFYNSTP